MVSISSYIQPPKVRSSTCRPRPTRRETRTSVPRKVDLSARFSIANESITTLMLCNIPYTLSQTIVLIYIDNEFGFKGKYDFFYLPLNSKTKTNAGYAFINFRNPQDCDHFRLAFEGYVFAGGSIGKTCPGHIQGLRANIDHFKKKHVDCWKSNRPLIFLNDGAVISTKEADIYLSQMDIIFSLNKPNISRNDDDEIISSSLANLESLVSCFDQQQQLLSKNDICQDRDHQLPGCEDIICAPYSERSLNTDDDLSFNDDDRRLSIDRWRSSPSITSLDFPCHPPKVAMVQLNGDCTVRS